MTPEVERLRGKIEGATLDEQITRIDELIAERDAAHARITHDEETIAKLIADGKAVVAMVEAWRACADRLAAALQGEWESNHAEHCGWPPHSPERPPGPVGCHWPRPVVLAEYERLAGES